MKVKYCACGKPIPQVTKTGTRLQPSRYAARVTCGSGVCVNNLRGPEGKYPDRRCKTCNEVISKYTRTGQLMRQSKYDSRKTCDSQKCKAAALNGHRVVRMIEIELSPMDQYLMGAL